MGYRHVASNGGMIMNDGCCGRKLSWYILKYFTSIFLEVLGAITETRRAAGAFRMQDKEL
jgi:hypothetical protein